MMVQVDNVVASLRVQWLGADYSMTSRNCCHFVEEFAKRVGLVQPPPSWLNRLARAGTRLGLE